MRQQQDKTSSKFYANPKLNHFQAGLVQTRLNQVNIWTLFAKKPIPNQELSSKRELNQDVCKWFAFIPGSNLDLM